MTRLSSWVCRPGTEGYNGNNGKWWQIEWDTQVNGNGEVVVVTRWGAGLVPGAGGSSKSKSFLSTSSAQRSVRQLMLSKMRKGYLSVDEVGLDELLADDEVVVARVQCVRCNGWFENGSAGALAFIGGRCASCQLAVAASDPFDIQRDIQAVAEAGARHWEPVRPHLRLNRQPTTMPMNREPVDKETGKPIEPPNWDAPKRQIDLGDDEDEV